MRLALDPLAHPIGSSDWRSNVSVAQAICLNEHSRQAHEGLFMQTWKWARHSSAIATDLAEEFKAADNHAMASEALRIAKRHDGVWRAANKCVRIDTHGKEVRAVVAVRSDAGDSTCPTFLDRQGRKRSQEMWPIVRACKLLGYTIAHAKSPPIPRERIKEALSFFADPAWRKLHFIAGVDIVIVPSLNGLVIAHVLAAFTSTPHNITLPVTLDFTPIIDIETMYAAPAASAYEMGPALWIEAQLSRFKDGKRCRDRLTYGCFYGKQAEEVVVAGGLLEKQQLSDASAATLREVEARISLATELTSRCLRSGDLDAARAAYGFVGAYIYDASIDLALYPLLAASLRFTSFVDFSGMTDSPIEPSIHDLYMSEVRALPHPKPQTLPQWRCIESVVIHSISDILALIDWARADVK